MNAWRRLVYVLLAVLALSLAAVLALDTWIESTDGRQLVERRLAAELGAPVRLAGEFDLRVLPPGVRGTEFQLLDTGGGEPVLRSRAYSMALAWRPLLRRVVEVDRLRLEWLVLGESGGPRFAIPSVEVSGFAVGRPTGVAVDLGPFGGIEGETTWHPDRALVAIDLAWSAEGRDAIELAGGLRYQPDLVYLDDLRTEIQGQHISGAGCLLQGVMPVLMLDLEAGSLDLDALADALPGGQGAAGGLPFELRLRLRAATLYRGGVKATDAVLEMGEAPACP